MGSVLTRSFHSNEVADITGATLRQLQHWDESKLVSPKVEASARVYTVREVIRAWVIVDMERRGYSLQSIRPLVPLIRSELQLVGKPLFDSSRTFYLITDCISVIVGDDTKSLVKIMASSDLAWTVLGLSDFVRKLPNGKTQRSAI